MHWIPFRQRRTAGAALVLAACCAAVATSQVPAPREAAATPSAGTAGLWISDSPIERGGRLLIVVDAATRHAAVYHVDAATGSMALRSARDIGWDLSLDEFNAQEPRPAAIRQMLQAAPAGPPPRVP